MQVMQANNWLYKSMCVFSSRLYCWMNPRLYFQRMRLDEISGVVARWHWPHRIGPFHAKCWSDWIMPVARDFSPPRAAEWPRWARVAWQRKWHSDAHWAFQPVVSSHVLQPSEDPTAWTRRTAYWHWGGTDQPPTQSCYCCLTVGCWAFQKD